MKASGAYFRSIVYTLIHPFLPHHVIQLLRSPLVLLRVIHQLLARRRYIFVLVHFGSRTIELLHAMHHLIDVLSHNVLDVDQILAQLRIAVQTARWLIVQTALCLDFLVCRSRFNTKSTKTGKRVGTSSCCENGLPSTEETV